MQQDTISMRDLHAQCWMLPILLNLGYGKSNLEKKIETEGQNRREREKNNIFLRVVLKYKVQPAKINLGLLHTAKCHKETQTQQYWMIVLRSKKTCNRITIQRDLRVFLSSFIFNTIPNDPLNLQPDNPIPNWLDFNQHWRWHRDIKISLG